MNASPERSPCIRFGIFEADVRAHELRKDGMRVRLQVQPFQVLAFLLERAGDVVTRDELRRKLWPSSVYVDFDHGLNNAIARLREALGDEAATPRFIETLPRVGYRFIFPLEAPPAQTSADIAAVPGETPASQVQEASRPNRTRRMAIVAVLSMVVIAAGLLAGWLIRGGEQPASASAGEASIAVLPFVSMSSDRENEYFADGLTEELTQKLAGIRGLKVAGRTSSYAFKGRNEPSAVIAKTLGVNHLLEGSVRRSGTRLRITAQLIDARDGYHLWSQSFDRNVSDIFEIQENIALAVATALEIRLASADAMRLRHRGTQDPEAYRLYTIARAHLQGLTVKRDLEYARQLFEQALARDPRFAAAHAGIAQYHLKRSFPTFLDPERDGQLGLAAAERAVALDPESSDALEARASFRYWQYRSRDDFAAYVQAQGDYRRAIDLDPVNVLALFDYGRAMVWHETDLARSVFERAVEVDPLARGAHNMIAAILSIQGEPQAARAQCQEWVSRHVADEQLCNIVLSVVARDYGNLDESVLRLRQVRPRDLSLQLVLWSLYLSLGDREAARNALNFGESDLARALASAASMTMDGRYREAFLALDGQRSQFEFSRVLDLPTARLALIAGEPVRALQILKPRMPDLVSGTEPVDAYNVLPALDLAAAWSRTGDATSANAMLTRVQAFFNGPSVPAVPYFEFIHARMHALRGESELALQALERAYQRGFRQTWAVDVQPQPFLYIDPIDVDPAFASLRKDQRFARWLARLNADNAAQLERLRTHDAPMART